MIFWTCFLRICRFHWFFFANHFSTCSSPKPATSGGLSLTGSQPPEPKPLRWMRWIGRCKSSSTPGAPLTAMALELRPARPFLEVMKMWETSETRPQNHHKSQYMAGKWWLMDVNGWLGWKHYLEKKNGYDLLMVMKQQQNPRFRLKKHVVPLKSPLWGILFCGQTQICQITLRETEWSDWRQKWRQLLYPYFDRKKNGFLFNQFWGNKFWVCK